MKAISRIDSILRNQSTYKENMITFFDSFIDNRNRWSIGKDFDHSCQIGQREYNIEIFTNNYNHMFSHCLPFNHENSFTIETRFKILSGEKGATFGVFWGVKGFDGHFFFRVNCDLSSYSYEEKEPGIFFPTTTKEGKIPFLIASNSVVSLIICKGENQNLQLGINDVLLQELPIRPFHGRSLGIVVKGVAKYAVYSFNVVSDAPSEQLRTTPKPSEPPVKEFRQEYDPYTGRRVYPISGGRFTTVYEEYIEDRHQNGNYSDDD